MIPKNVTKSQQKVLRIRAKKMLECKGLGWSLREIGKAFGVNESMVRKTFDRIASAKEGSLYWEVGR